MVEEKRIPDGYKNTEVGIIPNDWDVINLGENSLIKARIGWQGLRAEEFTDYGPFLVTGTDFVNGKIDWDTCYHIDERRFRQDVGIQLKERDLLITKDGTIGKTAIVHDCPEQATLNSGVFVVRAINGDVVPEYLYYVLNSHQFYLFMRNI